MSWSNNDIYYSAQALSYTEFAAGLAAAQNLYPRARKEAYGVKMSSQILSQHFYVCETLFRVEQGSSNDTLQRFCIDPLPDKT